MRGDKQAVESTFIDTWLICLVSSVPLVLTAIVARIDQGSWYAPGAFFALIWTVLVYVPLVLAPDIQVWPFTLIAISIAVGVFYGGSIVGMGGLALRVFPRRNVLFHDIVPDLGYQHGPTVALPGLASLTVLGSLSGCAGLLVLLNTEGFGIADLLSGDSFTMLARAFSIARYQHDYSPPAPVRFLLMLSYAGSLFGGALFAYGTNSRKRWLGLLPFLPAAGFMALLTTRTSVLYVLILWCSAYISVAILVVGQRKALFTKSFILKFLCGIPLAVMVSSLVLLARYGEDLDSFYALIWPRVRGDIVGHLPAFSEWLHGFLREGQAPSYGAYTFAGIFDVLGIKTRSLGMYEEIVTVGQGDLAFETNIYTVLRGLVQDFTLPGSLVVLFLLGVGSGKAYRAVISGTRGMVPVLATFYCFTLWSHIVSFAAYNTLILAYLLFLAYSLGTNRQRHVPFRR